MKSSIALGILMIFTVPHAISYDGIHEGFKKESDIVGLKGEIEIETKSVLELSEDIRREGLGKNTMVRFASHKLKLNHILSSYQSETVRGLQELYLYRSAINQVGNLVAIEKKKALIRKRIALIYSATRDAEIKVPSLKNETAERELPAIADIGAFKGIKQERNECAATAIFAILENQGHSPFHSVSDIYRAIGKKRHGFFELGNASVDAEGIYVFDVNSNGSDFSKLKSFGITVFADNSLPGILKSISLGNPVALSAPITKFGHENLGSIWHTVIVVGIDTGKKTLRYFDPLDGKAKIISYTSFTSTSDTMKYPYVSLTIDKK